MATNQKFNDGNQFDVLASEVTTPTGEEAKVSGAAALVGTLPVVLLTDPFDSHDAADRITVKTNGVYELPVSANDGAVATGDRVYAATAPAATLTLNNTSTSSTAFGYALAPVDSGATAEIPVKIHP